MDNQHGPNELAGQMSHKVRKVDHLACLQAPIFSLWSMRQKSSCLVRQNAPICHSAPHCGGLQLSVIVSGFLSLTMTVQRPPANGACKQSLMGTMTVAGVYKRMEP